MRDRNRALSACPDDPADREPTAEELAAIEREWPQIEADMARLDAEIAGLIYGPSAGDLAWRRYRRLARRVLAARIARGAVAA